MLTRSEPRTRHFRIGVVHMSLTTTEPRLLDEYTSLYDDYQTDHPGGRAIKIDVRRSPVSIRHRRRYRITTGGTTHFEPHRFEEVLPYVEWSLNLQIPRIMPESLQLHASAMRVADAGVILPGHSGVGKSTLTAGLLARGWRYLCDEFALIDANTLELQPYPRAICIKRASFPAVRAVGLTIHGGRRYVKAAKGPVGFIKPGSVRRDAIGTCCPVRFVIFPKYTEGAKPALVAITRAEAAFASLPYCYNLLQCSRTGLDVLTEMIRNARCYRLIAGDLEATSELLNELVVGHTCPLAQTA